ncbi:MAG TPA: YchJ family metal-binding protein [Myxococcota bacterium]|nr:YchJ family metal-binding protein [Myxococcota bacterium]
MARCPCRSGKTYKRCCRPWHQGALAPTPEALMRSRYSAYAMGHIDHVLRTQTPVPPREQVEAFVRSTRFSRLVVEEARGDTVTFTATLEQGGKDASFRERSRFEKVGGAWLYTTGERLGIEG